jgi:hypothetical protein
MECQTDQEEEEETPSVESAAQICKSRYYSELIIRVF